MMKHSAILTKSVVLVALLALIFASETHAYIDPGTTSYVLQLVIAGLVAASFGIKTFWGKIRTFFVGLISQEQKDKRDTD